MRLFLSAVSNALTMRRDRQQQQLMATRPDMVLDEWEQDGPKRGYVVFSPTCGGQQKPAAYRRAGFLRLTTCIWPG